MIQITVGRVDGVAGAPNPIMVAFGKNVPFSCFVRNEINGLRAMNEVVYSENEDGSRGVPYMPRPFPVGTWELKMPAQTSAPFLSPWFIPTTAWQMVDEWVTEQRESGEWYVAKTGRQVRDFGYGAHVCTNKEGLPVRESDGCLHIEDDPRAQKGKYDYLDELVNDLINWLKDPTMAQPPEIQIQAV